MEPLPARQAPGLMLRGKNALSYRKECGNEDVFLLADDAGMCQTWRNEAPDALIGVELVCPQMPEQPTHEGLQQSRSLAYIAHCKEALRAQLCDKAAFYFIHGAQSFSILRAAVIALGELTGQTIIAGISIETEDGLLADGTELISALGVLQRIGAASVILMAPERDILSAALIQAAPYARVSLGGMVHSAWLREGMRLTNTEMILQHKHDDEAQLAQAIIESGDQFRSRQRDHDDTILVSDGKHAHFILPTIDVSDEIACDHQLGEALLQAEEDTGAVALSIGNEEELLWLEEDLYMISRPICLRADTTELLEKALRIFPGLALYDGTWEIDDGILTYLEQKYGVIRL